MTAVAGTMSSVAGSTPERPGDPGTLLFENQRLRVWELIMKPGEVCNWHVHAYDHLLIIVEGCKVEARKANGTQVERDFADGTVIFIPANPVAEIARNISPDLTLRELIVDLKDPSAQSEAVAVFNFFQGGAATTTRTGSLDQPGSA